LALVYEHGHLLRRDFASVQIWMSKSAEQGYVPAQLGMVAELLYLNKLSSVYHGETGVRMLRELARSYLTIVKDLTRVMCRLKAMYRSLGDSLCRTGRLR